MLLVTMTRSAVGVAWKVVGSGVGLVGWVGRIGMIWGIGVVGGGVSFIRWVGVIRVIGVIREIGGVGFIRRVGMIGEVGVVGEIRKVESVTISQVERVLWVCSESFLASKLMSTDKYRGCEKSNDDSSCSSHYSFIDKCVDYFDWGVLWICFI